MRKVIEVGDYKVYLFPSGTCFVDSDKLGNCWMFNTLHQAMEWLCYNQRKE